MDDDDARSRRLRWFEQLFDALPMPVFIKDTEGRYVDVNARFIEAYGRGRHLTRDDLIGTSDFDHLPRPEAELYELKDRSVLDGGVIDGLREELLLEDGTVRFYDTTKMTVSGPGGEVEGLFAFSVPSETSDGVDAALVDSERRHRLALRASRDGIWELDVASRHVEVNARACELLDRPVAATTMTFDEVMALMPDTSATAVAEAVEAVIDDYRTTMSVRVDVVLESGRRAIFALQAAALSDAGRVTKLVGSLADVTDAVSNERRLERLASHDDLTDLPNRRLLIERVDEANRSGVEHSLLFCDLNEFKLVNDSLGHTAGDQLLVRVAELLRGVTRSVDLVARLGGDEFAVLAVGAPQSPGVRAMARRIIEVLDDAFMLDNGEVYTSVSLGMASTSADASADQVLRDADTAMYHAKRARDGVRIFEPAMRDKAVAEQKLQTEVRQAQERHEFCLHYQPLIDAVSGRITSTEALLRWRRDDGSLIPPGLFLPYLERSGMIVDVGAWIVDEAARQVAAWDRAGFDDLTVSVNLSRLQLLRVGFAEWIGVVLDGHGVAPDRVVFEVTETAIAGDNDLMTGTLSRLRELGSKVAIDDFGVGHSCLATLDELPVDVLKIDKSFVDRIGAGNETVLRSMLDLADELGLETVAEGVETAEQAEFLVSHGCTRLQGYWFDRPGPPDLVVERSVLGHPEGRYRAANGSVMSTRGALPSHGGSPIGPVSS